MSAVTSCDLARDHNRDNTFGAIMPSCGLGGGGVKWVGFVGEMVVVSWVGILVVG